MNQTTKVTDGWYPGTKDIDNGTREFNSEGGPEIANHGVQARRNPAGLESHALRHMWDQI